MKLVRRTLLAGAAACAPLLSLVGCALGARQTIRHILPSVTDTTIALTCSIVKPADAFFLRVNDEVYAGTKRDTHGYHWSFFIEDLVPDTQFMLQLIDGETWVGEAWSLRTFPAEDADVDALRLAAFTCAGGGNAFGFNGLEYFKPHAFRQRLFDDLLSRKPDAVIAIGDHIYWDLRGGSKPPLGRRKSALIRWVIGAYLRLKYGTFDRDLSLIG